MSNPSSTALVLIDLQNDYFPGGDMALVGADAAVHRAARLLAGFRERSLPVFHVQHIEADDQAPFFRPGTPGVDIHPAVRPAAGEPVIVKHFPNSFRGTSLLEDLNKAGVTELCFAGMMTHMCVDSTVRAAADLGFGCTVAEDACATTQLSLGGSDVDARAVQLAFLAALNDGLASVQSVDAVLAALGTGGSSTSNSKSSAMSQ